MAGLKSDTLTPGLRVGLYGGSFNPPHEGHRHVAQTALKRLQLDRVWWLVSPGNPLKDDAPAPLDARMDAVRRLAPGPRHVISSIEAQLGAGYTIDLLRHLQARHPGVRFVWIMGADGLGELHRWKDWREIIARIPLAVIARASAGPDPRFSRAAKALRQHRLPESQARALADRGAPGWTYLTEPLHPHASRLMRG
ncbi:nicotinate-nucleotide adenylyltransferase [Alkalicaulis satelles]|nr:nicotinate-nucleotide adenylyltransferase [Alkalicaulis satelles]